MATRTEEVEGAYRRHLAAKRPAIKTDAQIIRWLRGLGPNAISGWERGWLGRLLSG